mmetsp:Transcript_14611/g.12019  ORF Transcript_14611/g.12019 Transcript_14611/m.12019 type:complete len:91 (+) Transcript_14611:11-283(+)
MYIYTYIYVYINAYMYVNVHVHVDTHVHVYFHCVSLVFIYGKAAAQECYTATWAVATDLAQGVDTHTATHSNTLHRTDLARGVDRTVSAQ